MTNNLLPCPFCGKEISDSSIYIDEFSPSKCWYLQHDCKSHLNIILRRLTKEEIIEVWNKRS